MVVNIPFWRLTPSLHMCNQKQRHGRLGRNAGPRGRGSQSQGVVIFYFFLISLHVNTAGFLGEGMTRNLLDIPVGVWVAGLASHTHTHTSLSILGV